MIGVFTLGVSGLMVGCHSCNALPACPGADRSTQQQPVLMSCIHFILPLAGTITNAAKVLRQEGARAVYACATHAVFSPPAVERLGNGVFNEVIVTNTIAMDPERGEPPGLACFGLGFNPKPQPRLLPHSTVHLFAGGWGCRLHAGASCSVRNA